MVGNVPSNYSNQIGVGGHYVAEKPSYCKKMTTYASLVRKVLSSQKILSNSNLLSKALK